MKEFTLYAVARSGQVTGVFTTMEAASRCEKAVVSPICVPQLPGSNDMRGYVVSARGKWTSVQMTPQGVHSETFRPGPCWGVNVQTAIAGLFAPGGDLRLGCIPRRMEVTSLRLYRLGHDYGARSPENLALSFGVSDCVCELQQSGALSARTLATDYIALHERNEQRRQEMAARHDSGLPDRLAEHVLAVACARAPGKRGFCGTYLTRLARDLDLKIAREFTLRELQTLGAMLNLQEDLPIDPAEIPQAEQAALLARLEALTPPVRRTTGIRHADEDTAALARWILHPEPIDGAEVDIPEDAPD